MDSKRLCLALLLVGLSFGLALGQGDKAIVVGTVTDTTGAVIPGAEVYMTRVETNEVFSALTSDTGDYAFRALVSGNYELRVTMPGFKTERRSGLKLDVGQTYRIDTSLNIGEVAEVVEVQATAPILKTETPELGQVIDNKKIKSLPLNARDVFGALGSLTPGIQPTRSGLTLGGGVQFNVKGLRQSDNNGMLDGTQISETNGSLQFFVNPDAVQEFEVKSGLYGADYGIKPGGQFSAITKSGTNQLRSTLFWLHRNDNLDARSFFQREKTEFKRNQFGAVAGAPIMIPWLLDGTDKAWWFFAWQSERINQLATLTGTVPTADQKAGRFPTTIIDPTTGDPFANNTIPSSRVDPIFNKLAGFYPNPNTDPSRGFNYTSDRSTANRTRDEIIVKMDFKTAEDSTWSGRFLWSDRPITFVNAIEAFTRKNKLVNWAQNITNTRNFGANVVNEVGIHFFRRPYVPGEPPDHVGFGPTLGIPNWPLRGIDLDGVPRTHVSGFMTIGSRNNRGPVPEGQWEVKDNISWTKGSHFFKAGYHYRYHYVFFGLENRANFTFSPSRYTIPAGAAAGNNYSFANFMLGYLTSSRAGSEARLNHHFPGHYFYLQDSWKATSKLTVQIGLRFELRMGWQDKRGFSTNLEHLCVEQNPDKPIPTCYNPGLATPLGSVIYPETGRFETEKDIFDWTRNGWQPRLGLSYRVTDNTVLRVGGGLYGNEPPGGMLYSAAALGNVRENAGNQDFQANDSVPNLFLYNPFDPSTQRAGSPLIPGGGYERDMPSWYVPNWGVSLQHRLGQTMSLDVGYEGSRSVHEMQIFEYNDAVPGPQPRIERRPFPSLSTYRVLMGNGDQSYNAFNFKFEKRPGDDGLTLLLAYTWAKSLDTTGGRLSIVGDPRGLSRNIRGNLRMNRGRGEANIPGRLAVLGGYDIPFGKGRQYGGDSFFGKLLGGWSLYTLTTLQKGQWYTVFDTDRLRVGSSVNQRPNLAGNPNTGRRTPEEWTNTAAFVDPPRTTIDGVEGFYTYGNAGRGIAEGPGVINVDLSLLREFYLGEETRLEFRLEAFNLANHPLLLPTNSTWNYTAGSFGSIGRSGDGRQLQFGIKIYY